MEKENEHLIINGVRVLLPINKILGLDQPWALIDVMKKLIEVTDILLHEKNYDRHGWEEIEHCLGRGKEIVKMLEGNKL
jgi:predicted metalloenzyme YecM